MAKTRHQPEPSSNKSAMALMAAGGVLIGALVVWALTRTVEPSSGSVTSTETSATAPATTQPTTATQTSAIPTGTLPPGAITTATTTSPAPPQVQGDRSSVQRIAVEDLRAKMNRNEVTVVDVRDAGSFSAKHIAGAINIPFASVETMLDQIPKDKTIVTYCS
jgi:Rhodanese-like domain